MGRPGPKGAKGEPFDIPVSVFLYSWSLYPPHTVGAHGFGCILKKYNKDQTYDFYFASAWIWTFKLELNSIIVKILGRNCKKIQTEDMRKCMFVCMCVCVCVRL